MSKLFFLVGLAILAMASARVIREAPQTTEFSFENFMENLKTGFNSLEKTMLNAAGAKDSEDFKAKAGEYMNTVAKQWDTWAKEAQDKTKDLENVPAVQEVRNSIKTLVDDFNKNHPTVAADVQSYMKKFEESSKDVLTKIKDLPNGPEGQKLKELSEELLKNAQTNFETLTKDLKAKTA